MTQYIESDFFSNKFFVWMGVLFFLHNGSVVHASNSDMEIEVQRSKALQRQDVDKFFAEKNLWQDRGVFSPADMKDPQLEINKYMKLSKEYKNKGDLLSKNERKKAIRINVYLARNSLDLWLKYKYFERAKELSLSCANRDINVYS